MLTTKLIKSGRWLAIAAALTLGAAACSSSGASFKPGHYVAGAMLAQNIGTAVSPELDFYDYGILELDVADDGTITGTYQIYNDYFVVKGLPDFNTDTFDVTGEATGLEFTIDIDVETGTNDNTLDNIVLSGKGEITEDGQIGGVIPGVYHENPMLLSLAGLEVGATDVGIACGGYEFGDGATHNGGGQAMFMINEGKFYGAFIGDNLTGAIETPISLDPDACAASIDGCVIAKTATLDAAVKFESAVQQTLDMTFNVQAVTNGDTGETDLIISNGIGSNDTYDIGWGGSTSGCLGGGG